ncbi:hypothetical protein [Mesorhizobium australicum]|uniref:hypothetical protein n=1 Tax=Mesorhizobium australicum TaxID=536018 RepID=UPI000A1CB564|nr:hypothetical protein [Mesorhizobium australicum]
MKTWSEPISWCAATAAAMRCLATRRDNPAICPHRFGLRRVAAADKNAQVIFAKLTVGTYYRAAWRASGEVLNDRRSVPADVIRA